jgi:hypothetical protein
MIINNKAVAIESNVESKALNFGISDVRLVVDILSKLYAYPIRTLVQEYICNGRDAMREHGTWGKVPMLIGVPNKFEPTFKVRDYGCGITPDRMENIFVNYGSSTKRNTNAQTGGFGIGAKSAFSYTDSFSITSFVDGVKYLYVAHLGDNGGVNLINKESTTEANGVEISIGVKSNDILDFYDAVQRCVRYWTEPLKFQGVADGEIVQVKPVVTLDNMSVYAIGSGTIYLIDGIEYNLMEEETRSYWKTEPTLSSGSAIVAINLPNGYFKIASSRERLESNDDNKAKQKDTFAKCEAVISALVQSEIRNPARSLTHKIEKKKQYCGFQIVYQSKIELGDGRLDGHTLYTDQKFETRYAYGVGRLKNVKYNVKVDNRFSLKTSVVIDTSKETKQGTLPRRLNEYLRKNPTAVLIMCDNLTQLPHAKELFDIIIDSTTLPLPPANVSSKQKKSTRDSIVWLINSNGRMQQTVENLNCYPHSAVLVHEISEEIYKVSKFLRVYLIPKSNKDLVLKKGMTLDEGKKYLLSKHGKDVVGLSGLPAKHSQVKALKKFAGKSSLPDDLRSYLLSIDPSLQKKQDDLQAEYDALVEKHPLIKVLCELGHYSRNVNIIVDILNKEMV